ncbi:MAG: M28 family peptidase [Anaerolineaceae bacterium]|nr:M28 family peptidase [Anaerolineaceae bacterium]
MKYQKMDDKIFSRVWTDSTVEETLRYLCDECNGRLACTDDERRAGDYILAQFRSYGLENVHAEPFEMMGWIRGESTMIVNDGASEVTIDSWNMACSPGGDAAAELFDIGDGTEKQIQEMAGDISGKIILTNIKGPHRSIKYANCQKAGALGLVIYHGNPGSLKPAGSISLGEMPLKMPAIGISYESGMYLLRLMKQGKTLKVKLATTSRNETMTARNIVGEIPGTDSDAGWIVVGGHYDGHDVAQAAYDNGSGTALTVEVSRVLSQFRGELKTGIRFVLFSGEELGLNGSFAYTEQHPEALDTIRAVFNADIVGMEQPLVLMTQEAPEYATLLKSYADEGIDIVVNDQSFVPYSDHFPFALKGVSTLMAVTSHPENPTGWIHTTADTLDKVKFNVLKQACATAARVLLRMSMDSTALPRERLSEEKVLEIIRAHDYENTLKLQGLL